MSRPLTIAYLCTTFPKASETFIQREVAALRASGVRVRVYSFFGGGGVVEGETARRFRLWWLLSLPWAIPRETRHAPGLFWRLIRNCFGRRPPSWLGFWENMLGAGFACLFAREFRADPPDIVHAAWSGAPATGAWLLKQLTGIPYTTAAHAYDIWEDGGDWWLVEKMAEARAVHTSTIMAVRELHRRKVDPAKLHMIRHGFVTLPPRKALRESRTPLRLVSVARLVPKKGLRRQMRIYAALRDAGIAFEARVIGEGPMRATLAQMLAQLQLEKQVQLLGELAFDEVSRQLAWADVLLHTGIVAANGDRDGLPNVIPEAMAAGVLVVTSPTPGPLECVTDGRTGLVADPDAPTAWVNALCRLRDEAPLATSLQAAGRAWVEEHFVAERNAARLHAMLAEAAADRLAKASRDAESRGTLGQRNLIAGGARP